ncbi:MAG: antibiotic biosynthesis monooxygenase [Acidimicrobiales bacterium]|jgi:quinol monooxygenase YgiN|nr:antibiotic biosynthesis monooxygenase [Acidimicrobiales bacterium]
MIIIAGHLEFVDKESRDGAVVAGAKEQEATRGEEPGCLAYIFSADPCEDRNIQVYELWEDEATLAAHFHHPNYTNMRTVLRSFERTGGDVRKYRSDLSEPVYDDTGTARADFFTA